ncbi:uncharacterized protein [Amphiura filiformis]|uniref:uncharacterized protein n=1 Tax=Amphiura filiformis TaxID=82378 RepID=UPI003B2181D4
MHHSNQDDTDVDDVKLKWVNEANKKRIVFRMVGLTIIPILVLIAMNIIFVRDAITDRKAINHLKARVKSSMEDFGGLIHRLQIERGTTALYLSSHSDDILKKLRQHYISTDKAISNVSLWNAGNSNLQPSMAYFENKETFQNHLQQYRDHMNPNSTNLHDNMAFYTEAINEIIRWFDFSDIDVKTSHTIWSKLVDYELLVMAKEHNGVQRALGSSFYAMGGFRNHSMYLWFMNENLFGAASLENSMFFSKFVNDKYNKVLESKGDLISSIMSMENEIKLNDYENMEESWERGDFWFDRMTKYINVLFDLQLVLADNILSGLDEAIYVRQRESSISITIMVAVLFVSPIVIHAIFIQTRKIQRVSANLEMKTRELEEERERSDRLLHQMLPPTIALELKSSGTVKAEFYQEVTIFFSDVVNFTLMCAESTPMQVGKEK